MSKKQHSQKKWKEYIAHRQLDEADRVKRRRGRARRQTGFRVSQNRRLRITAPGNFSLVDNPQEVISFLNQIARFAPLHRLRILLEDIYRITPDAVLALIATFKDQKMRDISGTLPTDLSVRDILLESGFFEHVNHGLTLKASNGRIARFESNEVDGVLAQNLITYGTDKAFGAPTNSEPSYRVLVEGMQNTVDHAHYVAEFASKNMAIVETGSWWAIAYADVAHQKVCFALIDVGVGIFRSAKLKAWRKADRALRKDADINILQGMLAGRFESRTGLDHRGKGLPSIKALSDNNDIQQLVIVSNAVHAQVAQNKYSALPEAFRGTLLAWEISQ
jgi:hypothetical protein